MRPFFGKEEHEYLPIVRQVSSSHPPSFHDIPDFLFWMRVEQKIERDMTDYTIVQRIIHSLLIRIDPSLNHETISGWMAHDTNYDEVRFIQDGSYTGYMIDDHTYIMHSINEGENWAVVPTIKYSTFNPTTARFKLTFSESVIADFTL